MLFNGPAQNHEQYSRTHQLFSNVIVFLDFDDAAWAYRKLGIKVGMNSIPPHSFGKNLETAGIRA